jgi:hypothetical protein
MVVLTERMYVQRTSVLHIHGACLVFRLDMKQTYIPALISYGCSSAGDSHPDSVSFALVHILNFFILVYILPQISVSKRYIIVQSSSQEKWARQTFFLDILFCRQCRFPLKKKKSHIMRDR